MGPLPATTRDELTNMIELQGGRVLATKDIDGSDVVGITDGRPLNYDGSILRYWQPVIIHVNDMFRQLQEMATSDTGSTGRHTEVVPAHTEPDQRQAAAATATAAHERKRKAEHLGPLAEIPNLAGQNKRPMTDKQVEIVDLVNDD